MLPARARAPALLHASSHLRAPPQGEQNTEQEAWEQLDYCMSKGYNFIDTAEL